MPKFTNLFEAFRAYREENGTLPPLENVINPKDKNSYAREYYKNHTEKVKAYQRGYYAKHKDEIFLKRISPFQKKLLDYYKENQTQFGTIPVYQKTAEDLGTKVGYVANSTRVLIKKGLLYSNGYAIFVTKPKGDETVNSTPVANLFDDNEEDLYEDVETKQADEIFILKRKLKNAEDRYVQLLGEYEDYKTRVAVAYKNFIVANRNEDDAVIALGYEIKNNGASDLFE